MKRWGLWLGIAVVVVTNILALAGVARNRAGQPIETMELTERELPLLNSDMENSGIDLRLNWVRPARSAPEGHFECSQLAPLGFRVDFPEDAPASDFAPLPRIVFVALENGGAAWERWHQQHSSPATEPAAGNVPGNLPALPSHLVPVDADLTFSELRRRHPDSGRILIVRAVVRMQLQNVTDPVTGKVTSHHCYGYVADILPATVHVPLPYARLLASLKPRTGEDPRYTVTLAYGQNLEPWVTAITLR